jgi:HAMP domain-containing protein/HPt (histidine-containing phosphotransfer) domain-containing protein
MLGQMTASALFGEIDPSDTSLKESVHSLGTAVRTELTVIAKDGTVVADSETDDTHSLGSQREAPEIVAARSGKTGTAIRDGHMYVAAAIVRDGAVLGFARSAVPMSEVSAELVGVRARMAAGSGVAFVFAIAMGLFVSSALVRPIRALSRGARRVGAGDFEHVIRVSTSDEIGELARAFNEMTVNLRRTIAALDTRNHDMRLVLDNVEQGLLTIDRSGTISPERSAAVAKWFGEPIAGESFFEYLGRVDPRTAAMFELQWEELLEDTLPRALLLHQLPKRIAAFARTFELSYIPITSADDEILKLLIVITDVTARLQAERAEAEQREVVSMFERIMRDKSGMIDFLLEAKAQVEALTGSVRPLLTETKRTLHTLKGNAGVCGMQSLSKMCHDIETRMAEAGETEDVSEADRAALGQAWTATEQSLARFLGENERGIVIDDEEYASVLRALLEGAPRSEVIRIVREWKMERARPARALRRAGARSREAPASRRARGRGRRRRPACAAGRVGDLLGGLHPCRPQRSRPRDRIAGRAAPRGQERRRKPAPQRRTHRAIDPDRAR